MNSREDMISTEHEDFVHDISFDFFGKRLATCSSDQTIKIFQKDDKGKWIKKDSFQAHDAAIWKVKWAHPDFGSILASCSADRSVIIWEEKKHAHNTSSNPNPNEEKDSIYWKNVAKLLESKESIEDIKFAPKHQGLMLATASADGIIRIYEAPELFNLEYWRLIPGGDCIEVNKLGISSISWNKNPFECPMLIAGLKDEESSFMNKSAMKVQTSDNMTTQQYENTNYVVSPNEKYLHLYIFKDGIFNHLSDLSLELSDGSRLGHKSAVNDVSWNQLNGRSYHLITSCGKDGVFVWYLKFNKEDYKPNILDAKHVYNGGTNIWKSTFNLMGTLLVFSGQDNIFRICKGGYDRSWSEVEKFTEEDGDDDGINEKSVKNEKKLSLIKK